MFYLETLRVSFVKQTNGCKNGCMNHWEIHSFLPYLLALRIPFLFLFVHYDQWKVCIKAHETALNSFLKFTPANLVPCSHKSLSFENLLIFMDIKQVKGFAKSFYGDDVYLFIVISEGSTFYELWLMLLNSPSLWNRNGKALQLFQRSSLLWFLLLFMQII